MSSTPSSWPRWVMAFMGACTPGGFLFLVALLTEEHINMERPAWFILAAVGGAAGWFLGKRAAPVA